MNKSISLLVIADSHEAKIFEKIGDKNFDLHLVSKLEAELDSDHEKPGRTFNSSGSVRHAIEPHTDRRQVEKHKFAEKISHTLIELEKVNRFDGLIILASHKMLAELDHVLSDQLKHKITHRLAKDLIDFTTTDLKEYLEKHLM